MSPEEATAAPVPGPAELDDASLVQSAGHRPELVVGFVAPLGTKLPTVVDRFESEFHRVGYQVHRVKLTDLLMDLIEDAKFQPNAPVQQTSESERISTLQAAGNDLRSVCGNDAMALLGLAYMSSIRGDEPADNTAFLVTQLKHPKEVERLRALFGDRFILVGATSPRAVRQHALAEKFAVTSGTFDVHAMEPAAIQLINTDEKEKAVPHGQDVRDTFPLSDLFLDPALEGETENAIARFIDLLFDHQFHTPSIGEIGMQFASSISLRSAAMSRQVGAAILRPDGSLVSVGANDVPKPGGGVYWPHDTQDHRDHIEGSDSSNRLQKSMLMEIFGVLQEGGHLAEDIDGEQAGAFVDQAIADGLFSGTRALSLVEFGRTLHAEMDAILDAGRHGTSVQDCVLYTTTYPCHECTRHIIGAGIRKVVYVHPYPKSLADTLHPDAICLDGCTDGRVTFEPFTGVAPSRFRQMFTMRKRKDDAAGTKLEWSPTTARVVAEDRWGPIVAQAIETVVLEQFWDSLGETLPEDDPAAEAPDSPPEAPTVTP